jgi:hypothetical protein
MPAFPSTCIGVSSPNGGPFPAPNWKSAATNSGIPKGGRRRLTRSFVHSLIHSFIHSFIDSFNHSFFLSLVQSDEVYTQVGCELLRVVMAHDDLLLPILESSGLVQVGRNVAPCGEGAFIALCGIFIIYQEPSALRNGRIRLSIGGWCWVWVGSLHVGAASLYCLACLRLELQFEAVD